MRQEIHHYYDQLTDNERSALDSAVAAMLRSLWEAAVPLRGDDRAERAVDACARAIIESRSPRVAVGERPASS